MFLLSGYYAIPEARIVPFNSDTFSSLSQVRHWRPGRPCQDVPREGLKRPSFRRNPPVELGSNTGFQQESPPGRRGEDVKKGSGLLGGLLGLFGMSLLSKGSVHAGAALLRSLLGSLISSGAACGGRLGEAQCHRAGLRGFGKRQDRVDSDADALSQVLQQALELLAQQ